MALEEHKKEFGSYPGYAYFQAYAGAQALLNAAEKAETLDYEAVMKALRTELVDTPIGRIKFNEIGDVVGFGYSIYQVRSNKFVEFKW